jgi:hypothetical protein
MLDQTFSFTARLWVYSGKGAWHFVTVPKDVAEAIRFFRPTRGFVPVPVKATIGSTSWKTSVFPDSKSSSFLLAVKKDVRKAEGVGEGDQVNVRLSLPA